MSRFAVRKPAVSGQFYSNAFNSLKEDISRLTTQETRKKAVIACILPHAGYIYSGKVAGKTVSRIEIKDNVILVGPNHRGVGAAFSIMTEGVWQTPLGEIKINSDLAKSIFKKSTYFSDDQSAHIYEHSIEVELPFLQHFNPGLQIVPIVASEGPIGAYKEIGLGIASAIEESKLQRSALIVASSDMTHYEPQQEAERKDKQAIEAILALDEDALIERVKKDNISMCGYIPCFIMLVAAKALGAKSAELVEYKTSGDVTGDYSSVVGYAGIIIQ